MLKAIINEAHIRLHITTMGPLLVKTGYATVIGADMSPVMTYRNGHEEVYLPGSSLKGVFRSHIEKVVNSIKPRVACNPLARSESGKDDRQLYRLSCGGHLNDKMSSQKVYAESCPTCRLFGSTSHIGRINVEDAYLPRGTFEEKKLIEHRDGVAIDRLTGGTSGSAKFDLETVTADTTFTTTLHLRNFEVWQLGMLFVIVQDMEDELIHIGSGRSRGLGKVKATISQEQEGPHLGGVVLSTTRTNKASKEPENELWGLGRWLADEGEDEKTYDTRANDLITLSPPMAHTARGIRNVRVFKEDGRDKSGPYVAFKAQCVDSFVARMQEWTAASPSVMAGGRERA